MSSRRGGSGGGTFPLLVVLGLGAVLTGLVYAFWDQIANRFSDPPPVEREAREPGRPVAGRVKEPAERRPEPVGREPERRPEPAQRRVDPSVLSREREAARGYRLKAEGALGELDFAAAAEHFGDEASALPNDPDGAARAKALATKAGTFLTLTKDTKPNPAAGKSMVTLRRHSGHDIKNVVIVDETDSAYVIARRGMVIEVRRAEIREVVRMSPEEHRARLLREFEALEAKARTREASGPGYFALADRAFRDGLKGKALTYLEKAYTKDGADLPKAIRVAEAKGLLGLAIWCDSTGRTRSSKMHCRKVIRVYKDLPEQVADAKELLGKLSSPVAVADYKSTVRINIKRKPASTTARKEAPAPVEEEATVVTQKVRSGSSSNGELMSEINKSFDEAMDHYVKGRPGNPNSNTHLHKAAALFDKVTGLCDRALKNDPGNSQIESRQADASRYAYHSRKMSTLSLF